MGLPAFKEAKDVLSRPPPKLNLGAPRTTAQFRRAVSKLQARASEDVARWVADIERTKLALRSSIEEIVLAGDVLGSEAPDYLTDLEEMIEFTKTSIMVRERMRAEMEQEFERGAVKVSPKSALEAAFWRRSAGDFLGVVDQERAARENFLNFLVEVRSQYGPRTDADRPRAEGQSAEFAREFEFSESVRNSFWLACVLFLAGLGSGLLSLAFDSVTLSVTGAALLALGGISSLSWLEQAEREQVAS